MYTPVRQEENSLKINLNLANVSLFGKSMYKSELVQSSNVFLRFAS